MGQGGGECSGSNPLQLNSFKKSLSLQRLGGRQKNSLLPFLHSKAERGRLPPCRDGKILPLNLSLSVILLNRRYTHTLNENPCSLPLLEKKKKSRAHKFRILFVRDLLRLFPPNPCLFLLIGHQPGGMDGRDVLCAGRPLLLELGLLRPPYCGEL